MLALVEKPWEEDKNQQLTNLTLYDSGLESNPDHMVKVEHSRLCAINPYSRIPFIQDKV